jgi:glycerol-3-phosphate dehydrogenase
MAEQKLLTTARQTLLAQLQNPSTQWDALVVGGGITGAGIAREAARCGLKVLLVDRQDFAWGTSSRSSKMVHGGLRYLAAGDIKTTLHSVKERERLLQEAPGLVDKMGYIMPHYKRQFPSAILFNILLFFYDCLAKSKYRRHFSLPQLLNIIPGLQPDGLLSGTQFSDAITDDSRLVLRVLREAQIDGAELLNYMAVNSLIEKDGSVSGAVLTDVQTNQSYSIKAKVVISATGVWADELRSQLVPSHEIRSARGSHIVLPGWRLPIVQAITAMHPDDKRPIFIYDWQGRTVIGTTDLDHHNHDNAEVNMTKEELDYLLKATHHLFPTCQIVASDVISSWAGVRPLLDSGALNPSKEKRNHTVWSDNGLVTVSGGKLTTFRLIALDVLKAMSAYHPSVSVKDKEARVFCHVWPQHPKFNQLSRQHQSRLYGHYGQDVDNLLSLAYDNELQVIPGTQTLWVELRWAAAHEQILHLDDLLLRRTRIGLLLSEGGLCFQKRIQEICQEELEWSEQQWRDEWRRYQSLWQEYYFIPA